MKCNAPNQATHNPPIMVRYGAREKNVFSVDETSTERTLPPTFDAIAILYLGLKCDTAKATLRERHLVAIL